MGREVRRVPADWQHPQDATGRYITLFDGGKYDFHAAEWDEEHQDEEWAGDRPDPSNYMPNWPEAERTHLQMYETTSEGTPISPVMATPEELAHWLADNGASAFADMTATYEQWLTTIHRGWSPSASIGSEGLQSGVAALADREG
jgi:hypothetical protein